MIVLYELRNKNINMLKSIVTSVFVRQYSTIVCPLYKTVFATLFGCERTVAVMTNNKWVSSRLTLLLLFCSSITICCYCLCNNSRIISYLFGAFYFVHILHHILYICILYTYMNTYIFCFCAMTKHGHDTVINNIRFLFIQFFFFSILFFCCFVAAFDGEIVLCVWFVWVPRKLNRSLYHTQYTIYFVFAMASHCLA